VKLRYAIGGILVCAVLAFPGSAAAGHGGQVSSLASQQCAQEKSAIGKKAFHKRYGKRGMRNCVKRNRTKAATALTSAAQECQQELLQIGPDEFILDYAWDEDTVANAMSECVEQTIDDLLYPSDDDEDDEDDV
jgi:hypothetical protein